MFAMRTLRADLRAISIVWNFVELYQLKGNIDMEWNTVALCLVKCTFLICCPAYAFAIAMISSKPVDLDYYQPTVLLLSAL